MARLDWYVRANLKLRHLQLLVALDDYRHLGKVAAMLNVTQPALSKTLSELQAGLGVKLFERTGRGLRPTDCASVLIRHARKMLHDLAEAGDELHAVATGTARRVRVGTQPAAASWLLPRALVAMKKQAPEAAIFVREATMDLLLTELRVGNLDAIVGTLPSRRSASDLEEKALFDDATGLVVRPGHPLLAVRNPGWNDVAAWPWVLPPLESLLRQPLLAAFDANGVEPPTNYVETLSLNVALQYLQASDAVGTMPVTVAGRFAAAGQVVLLPLRLTGLMRPVGVMWQRSQPPTQGIRLLTACLEDVAKGLLV
jgi:DNA-binding transcriptional LysR family regulator